MLRRIRYEPLYSVIPRIPVMKRILHSTGAKNYELSTPRRNTENVGSSVTRTGSCKIIFIADEQGHANCAMKGSK